MPDPNEDRLELSPGVMSEGTNFLLRLDRQLALDSTITGNPQLVFGQPMPTFQLHEPKEVKRKPYSTVDQFNRLLSSTGSSGKALALMVTDIVKNRGIRLYGLERATGAGKIVLSGNFKPQFNQNPFKALIDGNLGDLKMTGADFSIKITAKF